MYPKIEPSHLLAGDIKNLFHRHCEKCSKTTKQPIQLKYKKSPKQENLSIFEGSS